jgi:hypothetical protein
MESLNQQFIKHLDSIINSYNIADAVKEKQREPIADKTAYGLVARARNAVEKISGKGSTYTKQVEEIFEKEWHISYKAEIIVGVIESLRDDLIDGYLSSITELVHGRIFNDFLEMSAYLLEEGYKDAAAVIVGGTLESHLRQLCIKSGLAIEQSTPNGGTRPKTASKMNDELGKIAYSLFDQKNVTAWLDLRNNAAHGKYTEYSSEQVNLLIEGIRDFIKRNPA